VDKLHSGSPLSGPNVHGNIGFPSGFFSAELSEYGREVSTPPLKCQRVMLNRERELYPPGFLEETAQTIALLFPFSDLNSRKWIRRVQKSDNVDIEAGLIPSAARNIRQYRYWREQLLLLKEAYDMTEPTSLRQWFFDKRKLNQRYTFWIGVAALILALLFGLIQSITGIWQAVASSRS